MGRASHREKSMTVGENAVGTIRSILGVFGMLILVAACGDDDATLTLGAVPEHVAGISNAGAFVLAASWQAAFCETRPNKPECRSQTADRFDATHFALHGLWPQPRSNVYCGVEKGLEAVDKTGRWRDLPRLDLTSDVRAALEQVMPGARSYLHRHEWVKHGTCYSAGSPEEYFVESLVLMQQLNDSPVRDLFVQKIGKVATRNEIAAAFDDAFGFGAGDRVELVCRQDGIRQIIVEIRINLDGKITPSSKMSDLIKAAAPRGNDCQAGIIDPVRLQ